MAVSPTSVALLIVTAPSAVVAPTVFEKVTFPVPAVSPSVSVFTRCQPSHAWPQV